MGRAPLVPPPTLGRGKPVFEAPLARGRGCAAVTDVKNVEDPADEAEVGTAD